MDLVIPTIAPQSNHCHGLQCKIINHKVSYMSQAENVMKTKVRYSAVGDEEESPTLESTFALHYL